MTRAQRFDVRPAQVQDCRKRGERDPMECGVLWFARVGPSLMSYIGPLPDACVCRHTFGREECPDHHGR